MSTKTSFLEPRGEAAHASALSKSSVGRFVYIESPTSLSSLEGKTALPYREVDESKGHKAAEEARAVPILRTSTLRGQGSVPKKSGKSISLPPEIQCTPTGTHVFRFVSTSASALPITVNDIYGAIGGICTVVNSTFTYWASSFKIQKINVWSSASTSASSSVICDWSTAYDQYVPDEAKDRTIPQGVTTTGGLTFTPPVKSLAGMWVTFNSAAAIMTLTIPVGSVLDFHVQYRLSNVIAPATVAIAVGVVGTVYYLALDGPASNKYKPVALPTTA